MKKTLLLSALAFTVIVNAQIKETQISPKSLPKQSLNKVTYAQTHPKSLYNQKTTAAVSQWYNFVDFLELVNPGAATGAFMNVFPDSTIILGLDNTNAPVYASIHKAGQYIDPSFFGYTNIANKFTTYKLDSLYFGYSYTRKSAPSVTDSVIIQIIAENHALDWTTSSGTFPYQDIEYNMVTNNVKASTPVLKRISIALTEADSTNAYNRIYVGTTGVPAQTNSKKIGVIIFFKPGYTWTSADTLLGDNTPVNAFFLTSFEQNGASTDPTVYGTANDYTTNMNMSMILPTDSRYDISSTGWNGFFLPTYAFTAPFRYETHDIGYLLSVADVGIDELTTKGFSLEQNAPNPFNNKSIINFELAKSAQNVAFTLNDVTGRLVSTEKLASTVGKHQITLTSYSAGVYYYTLTVDGISTTKKMIIE